MRAVPVVLVQPQWQVRGTLHGRLIGTAVGPLAQRRLDETLGLAIGSRRVRTSTKMLELEATAQAPKAPGQITGTIVGQYALESNAQASVIANSLDQGRANALAGFVGADRAEADAGVIVDGDMNVLPPGPLRTGPPIARHPMSWAMETAELLDIQMEQTSWLVVFVAQEGLGWLKAG